MKSIYRQIELALFRKPQANAEPVLPHIDPSAMLDHASQPRLIRPEMNEKRDPCAFGQLAPGPMRTLLDRFGGRIFGGGDAP